jgi:hypothetical protein
MFKSITRNELTSLVCRIAELHEEGYTYREIDEELELPSAGGNHAMSYRIRNSAEGRAILDQLSIVVI